MSKYKKNSSKETKNNWLTPTIITAVIGLIGTLVSLYFGYLTNTRPLELAATQTADARLFALTVAALTPTQSLPTVTATFPPPTMTLVPTPVQPTAVFTPTPTFTPTGLKFCLNTRSANVRSGPSTEFGAIGWLTFEDCIFFDGQNPDKTWLHISSGQDKYLHLNGGWVRSDLVRPQDFTELPIIQPPTATPTPEG